MLRTCETDRPPINCRSAGTVLNLIGTYNQKFHKKVQNWYNKPLSEAKRKNSDLVVYTPCKNWYECKYSGTFVVSHQNYNLHFSTNFFSLKKTGTFLQKFLICSAGPKYVKLSKDRPPINSVNLSKVSDCLFPAGKERGSKIGYGPLE